MTLPLVCRVHVSKRSRKSTSLVGTICPCRGSNTGKPPHPTSADRLFLTGRTRSFVEARETQMRNELHNIPKNRTK
jgi:hypothetical protein